jgi:branched-chain amino acid transport system substrate-binding protein
MTVMDAVGAPVPAVTYLIELHGRQYDLVWPQTAGNAKLRWPKPQWAMAGWVQ